jgi:hypothetical protein
MTRCRGAEATAERYPVYGIQGLFEIGYGRCGCVIDLHDDVSQPFRLLGGSSRFNSPPSRLSLFSPSFWPVPCSARHYEAEFVLNKGPVVLNFFHLFYYYGLVFDFAVAHYFTRPFCRPADLPLSGEVRAFR